MEIPVFHDDQHGTAIISGAALLNALELTGKASRQIHVVVRRRGRGRDRVRRACTSRSACEPRERAAGRHQGRASTRAAATSMNPYKARYAAKTDRPHAGRRHGGRRRVRRRVGRGHGDAGHGPVHGATGPIVFAMANPDPEITYELAKEARPDVIMATGRSDYPNQVNNVLGFPFIFRGALDVRATRHQRRDEDRGRAGARRAGQGRRARRRSSTPTAASASRSAPTTSSRSRSTPRVLPWEAPAVAKAAMETGVARQPIDGLDAYRAVARAPHPGQEPPGDPGLMQKAQALRTAAHGVPRRRARRRSCAPRRSAR